MDKSELPKNDQNHRITEWLELEGALKDLVLIPLPWAGTPEELQSAYQRRQKPVCVMGQSFSAAFKSS